MKALEKSKISWNERYRRNLYYFIRDELETMLIREALIESYQDFSSAGEEYPFVEMRELKPRAKIISPEHVRQRHFIVILCEDALPPSSKNRIRFFDSNKTTKENLSNLAQFNLQDAYSQKMRFFDDKRFPDLLQNLLESDYALLLQRDQTVKSRYRFALTHFHVRIDWPVAEAAEDLGRYLRYISKELYEKGDRVGEILQQKLYEYYGFHHLVGGRRTAALVAAQYLRRLDFLSTIYVASSEARALCRISETGISKFVLIRLANDVMAALAGNAKMEPEEFDAAYLIDKTPDYGVGIFQVGYQHNEHSVPPPDGKLRELNPDFPWLRVDLQLLVPPPSSEDVRPLPHSKVYS